MSVEEGLNSDFLDVLAALDEARAEFVIVGAHAMAVHGIPRATGDIDILVRPTRENSHRVYAALASFGATIEAHGIGEDDFAVPGVVYQMGLPPRRIDILTEISGVDFERVWASRVEATVGARSVPFIGREALIANERAAARDKDLLDVAALERGKQRD